MADAATIAKLEEGFKKVDAATDCKSLLKKYLSKSVFDQLKAKKTNLGATLLDVIQSGKLLWLLLHSMNTLLVYKIFYVLYGLVVKF